jgi:hypothetical protein
LLKQPQRSKAEVISDILSSQGLDPIMEEASFDSKKDGLSDRRSSHKKSFNEVLHLDLEDKLKDEEVQMVPEDAVSINSIKLSRPKSAESKPDSVENSEKSEKVLKDKVSPELPDKISEKVESPKIEK